MDIFSGSDSNDNSTGNESSPVLFGSRVTFANTPDKIRTLLPNSGRGWLVQKPCEYSSFQLSSNRTTKIINRKSAKEITSCTRADGDTVMVFVLAIINKNNISGGGGSSNQIINTHQSGMGGKSNGAQLNKDPAVFITKPKNSSIIERGVMGVSADGTAYDSKSVSIKCASGSESKDVSNDSWEITLPIGPGEHELNAKVDGDDKSVKFTVILKPAIRGYTAEDIHELRSYTNKAKIREVEQRADILAREAGLKEETDDYAGFALSRKVKEYVSNASGDFCLFYSGSGDEPFIEKEVTRIFGSHLSDATKTALVSELISKTKAGFVDATNAFHEAMNNTLNIFFAKNSVGRTISEMEIPLSVNPNIMLVMDAAKTVVNVKLNIELSFESNGAPLVMRNQAKKQLFDMVAVEVVGMAVGGVVLKVGSKAFKVLKSYFGKYKHKFSKFQKPQITADGKVIPLGKTEADAITIKMAKGAKKDKPFSKNGHSAFYDKDGFITLEHKFDTTISKKYIGSGKELEHFQAANKNIRDALKQNPKLANEMRLTDDQIKFFMKDPSLKSRPPGLTWHHHQDIGRMQLVNRQPHGSFSHTGGMSIWGGGYKK